MIGTKQSWCMRHSLCVITTPTFLLSSRLSSASDGLELQAPQPDCSHSWNCCKLHVEYSIEIICTVLLKVQCSQKVRMRYLFYCRSGSWNNFCELLKYCRILDGLRTTFTFVNLWLKMFVSCSMFPLTQQDFKSFSYCSSWLVKIMFFSKRPLIMI